MVGVARIELATPAMSTQCSTTELHAHTGYRRQESGGHLEAAFKEGILFPQGVIGRLEPPVLIFRLEQAVDLGHQVLQMERLRQ